MKNILFILLLIAFGGKKKEPLTTEQDAPKSYKQPSIEAWNRVITSNSWYKIKQNYLRIKYLNI